MIWLRLKTLINFLIFIVIGAPVLEHYRAGVVAGYVGWLETSGGRLVAFVRNDGSLQFMW